MEIVVATSILAHIGVLTIDRFASRFDAALHRPRDDALSPTALSSQTESETHPEPLPSSPQEPQNAEENTQQGPDGHSPPEAVDEDSVQFLQQRLNELRNQAKKLNTPDTLVQYARVTREANKVEKTLEEKKAEQGLTASTSMGVDAMTSALAEMLKPGAQAVRQGFATQMLRMVPRIIAFIFLWYYFSWRDASARQGIVMTVDCRALRPMSFLFRKMSPPCLDNDWVCAAEASQTPVCVISYPWALILCNVVISLLF